MQVRNNVVTTAGTAPSAPLQNDVWFDTTTELTKIYDGTAWLTVNLDTLAKKEDTANKSTDTNLSDATNTKFPTELAVKTYVDGRLIASIDDDITGVSFDGTNLKVDEGLTTFSADLSNLRDSDWFLTNSTDNATSINEDIYTWGNVGIGMNAPERGLHLAGDNSVIRLSRSTNTASIIFDRYSGTVNNTLKSFQFGLDASSSGVGEFFFADYNENIDGGNFTRIMTFTDGDEVIRLNQYGAGNFISTASSYLIGVESDGDLVEVNASNLTGHTFYKVGSTSAPDNINDNIYTQGNVGIGTIMPEAQLDIESSGVPLKITPSATTPTGTQSGQMFMGDDGILYAFDGSRGKWLSVDRQNVSWARASNTTSFEYLRAHNSNSQNNGYRMLRNATITAIIAQTNTASSWQLLVLKNDGTVSITTLNLTNETGKHVNNINIDVNEGDHIQAYCFGLNIVHPLASIEFAWRK